MELPSEQVELTALFVVSLTPMGLGGYEIGGPAGPVLTDTEATLELLHEGCCYAVRF